MCTLISLTVPCPTPAAPPNRMLAMKAKAVTGRKATKAIKATQKAMKYVMGGKAMKAMKATQSKSNKKSQARVRQYREHLKTQAGIAWVMRFIQAVRNY